MRTERIKAENDRDFVAKLRNTAYVPHDNIYGYMRNFAKWTLAIDRKKVAWFSVTEFVDDLRRHGYLIVENGVYQLGTLETAGGQQTELQFK